jgi:hypothetical protein
VDEQKSHGASSQVDSTVLDAPFATQTVEHGEGFTVDEAGDVITMATTAPIRCAYTIARRSSLENVVRRVAMIRKASTTVNSVLHVIFRCNVLSDIPMLRAIDACDRWLRWIASMMTAVPGSGCSATLVPGHYGCWRVRGRGSVGSDGIGYGRWHGSKLSTYRR